MALAIEWDIKHQLGLLLPGTNSLLPLMLVRKFYNRCNCEKDQGFLGFPVLCFFLFVLYNLMCNFKMYIDINVTFECIIHKNAQSLIFCSAFML